MTDLAHARLFVAGSSGLAVPTVGRIEIDGARVELLTRDYSDPVTRRGRGGNPGAIAALSTITDCEGGEWLLASVERGRPRLLDPERLGVVGLLGRRREWRGAAEHRQPFLQIVCDRAPVTVSSGRFTLTRSPAGMLELVRVYPGAALERWSLGTLPGRVELLACEGWLALLAGDRLALIELDELVPGGCPLTDPRDVELPLRWRALPGTVAAVCDLPTAKRLRVIEREPGRWAVAELELGGEQVRRSASWTIERPDRWRSAGTSLWIHAGSRWIRVELGRGPVERSAAPGGGVATVERDAAGHSWLWLWDQDAAELRRVDALALADGPVARWPIPAELRPQRLLVTTPSPEGAPRPDPRVIRPGDELAELLALEPELAEAWPRWFEDPRDS